MAKELPHELHYCIYLLASELGKKKVNYNGDMSDFGNEVGYALGTVIEEMTPKQINEFISGLKHGISLTNGTH